MFVLVSPQHRYHESILMADEQYIKSFGEQFNRMPFYVRHNKTRVVKYSTGVYTWKTLYRL